MDGITIAPNLIGFDSSRVSPPSSNYVTKDDVLSVQLRSTAAFAVNVAFRILLANGQVSYNFFQVTTTGAPGGDSFTFALPDGFLLSVVVLATTTVRGQLYGNVQIIRSAGSALITLNNEVIANGYIYASHPLSFPPTVVQELRDGAGAMRSITGTTPGAGSEITEVVPANRQWRLFAFLFNLTTAVAVANRVPHLILDDGALVYYNKPVTTVQAASLTIKYACATNDRDIAVTDLVSSVNIPSPLILPAGHRIRTSTTALQAADQYTSPQYVVEEFILT